MQQSGGLARTYDIDKRDIIAVLSNSILYYFTDQQK